jgi:hypothetical protein
MTFVVGENCIKCKHTDCVEVCPVDCFYEGPNFLVSILMSALIAHCASQSAPLTLFFQKMSYQQIRKLS